MARKKKAEEHENLERWLVSYADFITLLFAFFVTMYASSRVDENKMGSAVESLQRALGAVIAVPVPSRQAGVFHDFSNPVQVTIVPISIPHGKEVEKLAQELKKRIEGPQGNGANKAGAKAYQVSFLLQERGLVIRVSDQFFFHTGEAAIRPEVLPFLKILGQTLQGVGNPIRIEGHTDNVPINTAQFPSNWSFPRRGRPPSSAISSPTFNSTLKSSRPPGTGSIGRSPPMIPRRAGIRIAEWT